MDPTIMQALITAVGTIGSAALAFLASQSAAKTSSDKTIALLKYRMDETDKQISLLRADINNKLDNQIKMDKQMTELATRMSAVERDVRDIKNRIEK